MLAWMTLVAPLVDAQEASVSAVELAGTWSLSETLPDGRVMQVELLLMHNRTFSCVGTVEGQSAEGKSADGKSRDAKPADGNFTTVAPFWTCSGSWQVRGRQVVWNYVNSSRPLTGSARADTDDIVSVDETTLVLLSHATGKRRELSRVQLRQ